MSNTSKQEELDTLLSTLTPAFRQWLQPQLEQLISTARKEAYDNGYKKGVEDEIQCVETSGEHVDTTNKKRLSPNIAVMKSKSDTSLPPVFSGVNIIELLDYVTEEHLFDWAVKLRDDIKELKNNTTKPNTTNEAAQRTVDYLYKIDGELTPEQYQAISTLRQLINEEFKPQKQVSNQFIYSVLKGIL